MTITDHRSYTSWVDKDTGLMLAAIWKHDSDVIWYPPSYHLGEPAVIIRCGSHLKALTLLYEALNI